jgi:hypothetical protein
MMSKLARSALLAALVASPAAAESNVPDLRGTWTGDSETIVLGRGNDHHTSKGAPAPRMSSASFTLTVDQQDGRRFSGTFSSPRHSEKVIAVVSRSGPIYLIDDDGYSIGTMLAPNRMELCYLKQSPNSRIASCTELTKR